MPSEIIFRQATRADVVKYYGKDPIFTFRGHVAEKDGEILGVGGVYYDFGVPVVFTEMRPEMAQNKRACAKATRFMIGYVDSMDSQVVYAVADPRYKTSGYLLAKLGFVPTGRMTELGELLARRK